MGEVNKKTQTWLWWSGGKDSAWALRELQRSEHHSVTRLVTTFDPESDMVPMQAIPRPLIEKQAASLGLPVHFVAVPENASNSRYETSVAQLLVEAMQSEVTRMAFGDIFLRDVRAYRERLLQGSGIEPMFPLWDCDTRVLARTMIDGGLRAVISCVDTTQLDSSFAGRHYDNDLLHDLPTDVDPCGENGEFHTFVSCAPGFTQSIGFEVGEKSSDGRFDSVIISHA